MKAIVLSVLGAWILLFSVVGHTQTRTSHADAIFTRAELDQILAPIALYPDAVLSHVLIASTYPLEVVQADRWVQANAHLFGEDAVNVASLEGWDPSVAALTAFPDLLHRMSSDLQWTQNLGDAFLADEGRVMDAIQNLREKAYRTGTLKKMSQVKVTREDKIIIIEPAQEKIVYIPYYDSRVVYGPWWWDSYPPYYWDRPSTFVQFGSFFWSPRAHLNHFFFFSAPHWHARRIVVVDYHKHPQTRFYSSRPLVHFHGARRWEHNPYHRHTVIYRNEAVRERYRSFSDSRAAHRNLMGPTQHRAHHNANPREQARRDFITRQPRTDRAELRDHREERKDNQSIRLSDRSSRSPSRERVDFAGPQSAEQVRTRLSERSPNHIDRAERAARVPPFNTPSERPARNELRPQKEEHAFTNREERSSSSRAERTLAERKPPESRTEQRTRNDGIFRDNRPSRVESPRHMESSRQRDVSPSRIERSTRDHSSSFRSSDRGEPRRGAER